MQPTVTFRGRSPGYVNLTVFVALRLRLVSVVTGPLLRVWLWASPPLPGARLQLGEFSLKDVKLPSMVQVETVECLIPVSY